MGVLLSNHAYREVNVEFELEESRYQPFTLAAYGVMRHACDWRDGAFPAREVTFVFDRRPRLGNLFSLARRRGLTVRGGDARQELALQACDFIAWEGQRFYSKAMAPFYGLDGRDRAETEPPRGSFGPLVTSFGEQWIVLKAEDLRDLCVRAGIKRRLGGAESASTRP